MKNTVSVQRTEKFRTISAELWYIDPVSETDFEQILRDLAQNPLVEYAEPNYVIKVGSVPNDTHFDQLWGLHNTGQTGGTAGADINILPAWGITQGNADIILGVIDTGVDYNHPDLQNNMWVNMGEIPDNNIDDDGNGYVDDYYGYDFYNNDGDPF